MTLQFLAVRSAILATAWLLVSHADIMSNFVIAMQVDHSRFLRIKWRSRCYKRAIRTQADRSSAGTVILWLMQLETRSFTLTANGAILQSTYTISYQSLVVTISLSRTVSEMSSLLQRALLSERNYKFLLYVHTCTLISIC